ncbi:hypothetical protein D3C74_383580 [compost metagenome]
MSRITMIRIRMAVGASVRPSRPLEIAAGMPEKAMTHAMMVETPTSNITIAVVTVASRTMRGRSLTLIARYAKPRTRQYTTAITADSVGVKMPARMPPITMTIIRIEGTARHSVSNAIVRVTRW